MRIWTQLKKVWGEILAADPAGLEASEARFYYNSVSKVFRFHDGTSWQDMNAGIAIIPAGLITPFGGATIPAGWLPCDGTVRAQATFPGLYAEIAAIYGSDAGGNFTLPDIRARVPRGADPGNSALLGAKFIGDTESDLTKRNGLTLSQNTGLAVTNHTHEFSHVHSAAYVGVNGEFFMENGVDTSQTSLLPQINNASHRLFKRFRMLPNGFDLNNNFNQWDGPSVPIGERYSSGAIQPPIGTGGNDSNTSQGGGNKSVILDGGDNETRSRGLVTNYMIKT
jgi:microcystin-dependent protein